MGWNNQTGKPERYYTDPVTGYAIGNLSSITSALTVINFLPGSTDPILDTAIKTGSYIFFSTIFAIASFSLIHNFLGKMGDPYYIFLGWLSSTTGLVIPDLLSKVNHSGLDAVVRAQIWLSSNIIGGAVGTMLRKRK